VNPPSYDQGEAIAGIRQEDCKDISGRAEGERERREKESAQQGRPSKKKRGATQKKRDHP